VETAYAYRANHFAYREYLRTHAWFFILLTVAYGAITGFGIWWTIGLASPLATEFLIRTFVFGWAMEYVFFIIEIVSAFVFFYFWGRLPQRTHIAVGWIYAISAWMSLVLITGITSFMLNPGSAFLERPGFWAGLFNPQFVPQVLARTGSALLLASLYVYLHASFKITQAPLKQLIQKRSARPALVGAILLSVGGFGWLLALPPSAKSALVSSPVLNIFLVAAFAMTVVVFVMLYAGPFKNPGWLSPGFAALFFLLGIAAVGAGEFLREAVRKPYIIYNVILSNQIYAAEVGRFREAGAVNRGRWLKAYLARKYDEPADGFRVNTAFLRIYPKHEQTEIARALFMYHCNACHALDKGHSAVAHLTLGWSDAMIREVVLHPEKARISMPPWSGSPGEAALLAEFLIRISEKRPPGMNFGEGHVDGG
jgi:hypothetical protein